MFTVFRSPLHKILYLEKGWLTTLEVDMPNHQGSLRHEKGERYCSQMTSRGNIPVRLLHHGNVQGGLQKHSRCKGQVHILPRHWENGRDAGWQMRFRRLLVGSLWRGYHQCSHKWMESHLNHRSSLPDLCSPENILTFIIQWSFKNQTEYRMVT